MAQHHGSTHSESHTTLLVPGDDWAEKPYEPYQMNRTQAMRRLAKLMNEWADSGIPEPRQRECMYLAAQILGGDR